MPNRYEDEHYKKHSVGLYREGGDENACFLLHDSPPDQESLRVVLLDCFRCCESGKVIKIQRHQFSCICEQADLG